MPIDIDKLTEAELVDLDRRLVERLRFPRQMRAHARMLGSRIGDRAAFAAEGGVRIEGVLTRYDRKTATVITDDGRRWTVSPSFLLRAAPAAAEAHARSNVVSLG